MDINERILKIIEHEHLNIASFARKIGIGDQTVRAVCVMKRNKPSFEFLSRIVQTFVWLNPSWLLTGEGDMEVSENSIEPLGTPHNANLKELISYLREKDAKIEKLIAEKTAFEILYNQLSANK